MSAMGTFIREERGVEFVENFPSDKDQPEVPEPRKGPEFPDLGTTNDMLLEGRLGTCPSFKRNPFRAMIWVWRAGFGAVSLLLMLAILAAIPIVNLFVAGYLIDVQGRLAREGKFGHALPLIHLAPRFGSIVFGTWLFLFPLRLVTSLASDAALIAPESIASVGWQRVHAVFTVLIFFHLLFALARGGSWPCFFRPVKNVRWVVSKLKAGTYLQSADSHIRGFIADLRIPDYFSLGFRGCLGAMLWLFPPTLLFAAAREPKGGAFVVTLLGGGLLALALSWLPLLQTRFAITNRFRAFFDLKSARLLQSRSPLLWLLAYTVCFGLSLVLYLFKIVAPPADALWFFTLIFLVTIYPTKLIIGRLVFHSRDKARPPRIWRWSLKPITTALLWFYVFVLFFTQFIGANGKAVLFSHHLFLVPSPFIFPQ